MKRDEAFYLTMFQSIYITLNILHVYVHITLLRLAYNHMCFKII